MVIEKARELGIELSKSKEFLELMRVRNELDNDEALAERINEYGNIHSEISALMEQQNVDMDIVLAKSHDLELLRGELVANPLFSRMLNAQSEFQKLMNQVNTVISACIGMDTDQSSCTHDCNTCSGCMH